MKILNRIDEKDGILYFSYFEDGQIKYDVIKNFYYYFYGSNHFDELIINVNKVNKVIVADRKDYSKMIREYKYLYEADLSLKKRFLIDNYYNVLKLDKVKRNVGVLDIELLVDDSRVDFSGDDRYPINAISISFNDKIYTFYFSDVEVNKKDCFFYKNEIDMLIGFIDFFSNCNFNIITGWNVSFDINTLCKRILKVLGSNYLNKLSKFNIVRYNDFRKIYEIFGINIIDYIEIFKKFKMKSLRSYSLNNVASEVLNRKKIDINSDFLNVYKNNLNLFLDYNRMDIELVLEIEKKVKNLDLLLEINSFGIENLEDTLNTTFTIDNILLRVLKRNGFVARSKKNIVNEDKIKIVGGYLFNVKPEIINNYILTYDVVSLYPSIIRMLNISMETLDENGDLLSGYYLVNGVNLRFNSSKKGIIAQFEDYFFNLRIKEKEKMKSIENKEEREVYNTRQKAFKILINALYGYLGFVNCRFFVNDVNKNLANAVTQTGRLIIQKIARIIKKEGNRIVAGDTDSVMFTNEKFRGMSIEQIIDYGNELQEKVNIEMRKFLNEMFNIKNVDIFKVNFEKVASSGIHFYQRRYIHRLVWKEGERINEDVFVGVEIITANTSDFSIKMMNELYKMLLDNCSKDEVKNKIIEYKSMIKKINISELGFPFIINKNINNYKVNSIHIKGVLYFNKYFGNKGFKDFNGSVKGKYFLIKAVPVGFEETNVLAINEENYDKIDLILSGFILDYKKIEERLIDSKVENILKLLDIELENSLF